MRKILVVDCEQEISSFNPLPSQYADFAILRGKALFEAHADADTCIRGFRDVLGPERGFRARPRLRRVGLQRRPLVARKASTGCRASFSMRSIRRCRRR